MREPDPFKFRDDPAWAKLVAWLLLQARIAISTSCVTVCVLAQMPELPFVRAVVRLFSGV